MEKSKVVIDLCAAPGSWCQVASSVCPVNSLIIGVDLAPIKPLPNVISFQSDITTEHCRSTLRGHMKTWKADTVMHDGAPNVGMAWTQDAFTQSELVLQSLKLAVEFLIQGGIFVTKVFRSKDYNNLLWVFQQFFDKVEATKPPASRNVSAEIFVVCRGFKAPKKIDPRLLDSKHVFEELQEGPQNMQQKVFNPELKRRKRDGYEEGDYLQFHTMSALEFIKHEDPIQCLGSMSQFTFDYKNEEELYTIRKLPETTDELLECFKDLKVLGKKDFRLILKWRKACREFLKLDKNEEDEQDKVEIEPLTEEEQIAKEIEEIKQKKLGKTKREKRKSNERKQKEIMRMQMNMLTPAEIGIEAGYNGTESLFNLKQAERTGKLNSLVKGKKNIVVEENDEQEDEMSQNEGEHVDSDYDSDQAMDDLDVELDSMYQQYKEQKAERDMKYEAKRAREKEDDGWMGFSENSDNSDTLAEREESSDEDSDEESLNLITSLRKENGDLSRKASIFFSNSIFDGVELTPDNNGDDKAVEKGIKDRLPIKTCYTASESEVGEDSENEDFEIVAREHASESEDEGWDASTTKEPKSPYVDIVTTQAMTLAHQIALGQKTKHELIDEGYNRYAFRDRDGLPEWFLDDEQRHSKISKPVTKEAAEAIKAKLKAMNARPVKKVAEAKARKKMKAMKKLEGLRKKSGLILEDGDKSERDKSEEITKMMKKLGNKKTNKPKITVVAAKGANKRLQGRPKGVKGRYKMVDGTLKKEQRALNRISKKRN